MNQTTKTPEVDDDAQRPPSIGRPYSLTATLTSEGLELELGDSLLELLGYSREEITGPEVWRTLLPDDQDLADWAIKEFQAGRGWEGRVDGLRTKDGQSLVMDTSLWVDESSGDQLVIQGRARDVTELAAVERRLKDIEARLDLLSEHLPIVMWACDPQLRVKWSWGPAEEADLRGETLYERVAGEESGAMVVDAHRRALQGEEVTYEVPIRGRHYRAWLHPHTSSSGEVLEVSGLAVDVTEQRWLEREVKDIGRELGPTRRDLIKIGELEIQVDRFQVLSAGRPIELTPTEFRLLVELARHPGQVLTREALLRRVWGYDFLASESAINTAVMRLRAKLGEAGDHRLIETVRGVGYRLRQPPPGN